MQSALSSTIAPLKTRQIADSTAISPLWRHVGMCFMAATWLLPNHYHPWAAFHADAWCAVVLSSAALLVTLGSVSPMTWHGPALLTAILVFVPGLQFGLGLISFSGQAWITAAYLLGLLLAMLAGQRWEQIRPDQLAGSLFGAIGLAAVGSVAFQLQTWMGLIDTGIFDIWSMGLSGARPYANLGQPNQLATLLLWGLLASAWAYITHKIRGAVAILIACFLFIGIALTQSRTAWLGLIFFLFATWAWKRHWPSKQAPWVVTMLFGVFWLYPSLLRMLTDVLLLGTEASYFRGQIQGELRLPAWNLFTTAVMQRPWLGYGWTEVGHAQLAVAENFPPLYPTFGHSHNLFLDLSLWLGLPLGLFVSGAVIWRFGSYARKVSNASEAILVMFLGAIGIHAMLEFPLYYAYFLLPTGLVVGVLNQRLHEQPAWTTPRWTMIGLWLVTVLLLAGIIRDYFKAEASFQDVRFELAHIGNRPPGQAPDVLFLTQLRERISYMRYEVRTGMTQEELDWLQKVVNAYPSGGMAYKAARALALNQQPTQAQQWLRKVCKISSPDECALIKRVWAKDAQASSLIASVNWPDEKQ